jgi:Protein of unknown function with PCYCGC motif
MSKKNALLGFVVVLAAIGAGLIVMRAGQKNPVTPGNTVAENTATPPKPRVPSFQSTQQARSLGPTLEPTEFFGKAREAYQVAKKIPQTLAQLPCYCHCDQSFGHKSLHTCFEDDHASHCAVCVDEALLAYQLQSQQNLSPEQVRDVIIEKYSGGHDHAH